ncbi:MAG: PilN domain-containing protein [Deltaproteobacteria bacterium]|nr:PilN domain-containing protein [Deltaproteobacteria bacterium]
MIRINLLPFRAARSKENIRRQVSVFLLSLSLLIVVLVGINIILGKKVNSSESRLASIKQEVRVYEKKAAKVEEFKKQLDALNKKIEVVDQLKTHRKEPPQLLSAFTEMVVPGRMQITKLELNGDNFDIGGVALDNETIAVFMKRIERSKRFKSVVLTSSRQARQFNVDMKQFGIKCKMAMKNDKAKDKAEKK